MRVYQFRHIRAEGQFSGIGGPKRGTPNGAEPTYHAASLRRSSLPLALALLAVFALLAAGSAAAPPRGSGNLVEVVVTLPRPALAVAVAHDRTLAAAAKRRHSLAVSAPAAVSYLHTLATAQQTLSARLARRSPRRMSTGTTELRSTASPSSFPPPILRASARSRARPSGRASRTTRSIRPPRRRRRPRIRARV